MRVEIEIANPMSPLEVTILQADVDVSSRITTVHQSVAKKLGLEIRGIDPKNGMHQSFAQLSLHGRDTVTTIWLINDATVPIIGLAALTGLCLEVDKVSGRLVPFEPLLLTAS